MSPANPELSFEPPAGLGSTPLLVRRLSDLQAYYTDQEAVRQQLASDDPDIYAYWAIEYPGEGAGLSYGVTTIQPGVVGREFYMTKGHFHTAPGDEIYLALSGHGRVVLRNDEGEVRTFELTPGRMVYINEGWGHRTANVGVDPLVFVSIWTPGTGHDYDRVLQEGFPTVTDETVSLRRSEGG
jgi:glucose-6-phosphate isomerase